MSRLRRGKKSFPIHLATISENRYYKSIFRIRLVNFEVGYKLSAGMVCAHWGLCIAMCEYLCVSMCVWVCVCELVCACEVGWTDKHISKLPHKWVNEEQDKCRLFLQPCERVCFHVGSVPQCLRLCHLGDCIVVDWWFFNWTKEDDKNRTNELTSSASYLGSLSKNWSLILRLLVCVAVCVCVWFVHTRMPV